MVGVFKKAAFEFLSDRVPRLAAALAYYSLFSLAPLLVISIAIAGFAFGEEAARGQIVGQIRGLVGTVGAKAIEEMIENAGKEESNGIVATVAGVIALLFGASGVFGQLKDTLNTIWGVPTENQSGIKAILRERFWSFTMVLVIGFLLLISLVVSAVIAAVGNYLSGGSTETVWQIVNFVVSISVITVLFALIFKFVPDARVAWRDVWVGAAVTSILFVIGKFAIGLYLGKSTIASTYGAAASLIVLLIWLYYSSMIVFFGAEFTEVYSRHESRSVRPRNSDATSSGDARLSRPSRGRGGPLSAPLPVAPLKRTRRLSRRRPGKGGIGKTLLAGLGGVFVGVVLTVVGALVAAVKGASRLVRR